VFDNGTNVGIFTNTPAYRLHVTSNFANDYLGAFENGDATGSALLGSVTGTFNALGGATTNATGLGVYGVHLSATGAGLGVYGISNSSDATGVLGQVPTTGAWLGYGGYFTGGLGYEDGLYNLSDSRVKKNVLPLNSALSKLLQLNGYTYQYSDAAGMNKNDKTYIGFVAQEVKSIFPEAVAEKLRKSTNEVAGKSGDASAFGKETYNVVDYVSLIPVLVEAIKEQEARIKGLEATVEELKRK
jgi:hypothetical protein